MRLKLNKMNGRIIYLFVVCLFVFSCKSKEQKLNDFVFKYNQVLGEGGFPSAVGSSKAIYKNGEEVIIEMQLNFLKDDLQATMIAKTAPDIFFNIIKAVPEGQALFNEGVKFNLQLYDRSRLRFADTILSKQTFKSVDVKEKDEMSSMIAVLNSKMPIVDPESGISILQIAFDKNKEVVYTYQYPEDLIKVLEVVDTETLLKQNVANNPILKQMLLGEVGQQVNKVVFVIVDKDKKEVKRVSMTRQELIVLGSTNQKISEGDMVVPGLVRELNKRLPITDERFGFKYLKCELKNTTLVNTYLVPDKYIEVLDVLEQDGSIKKGIMGLELIGKIVNFPEANLEKVTSIYQDKKGKVLKSYTITKEAFNAKKK